MNGVLTAPMVDTALYASFLVGVVTYTSNPPEGSDQFDAQSVRAVRRDGRQRTMLVGLGLNKMGRTREIVDTPATRGMLDKLKHMVRVVED